MAAPIEVTPGSGGPASDAALAAASGKAIEGRSLGQLAWLRLRRDKLAIAGGVVIVLLILIAVVGPHLVQSPNVYHQDLINPSLSSPYGALGGVTPTPRNDSAASNRMLVGMSRVE